MFYCMLCSIAYTMGLILASIYTFRYSNSAIPIRSLFHRAYGNKRPNYFGIQVPCEKWKHDN